MKKRMISVILAVSMLLSQFGTTAFAQDGGLPEGGNPIGVSDPASSQEDDITSGASKLTDPQDNDPQDSGPVPSTQPECVCGVLCAEGSVNADCPICGEDFGLCEGVEAAAESCLCTEVCTEDSVNPDCPICGAEGADLTQCQGQEQTEEPLAAVQKLIDALPDGKEITEDNAEEVMEQLEAIDEAKTQLTDEEREQLDLTRYLEAAAALEALAGLAGANTLASAAIANSGNCGAAGKEASVTWTLDDAGLLTIRGKGEMANYIWPDGSPPSAPWTPWSENIKSVVIESGVTSIGNYAFQNCTGLTSVTIPDSVTSIKNSVFTGCTSLETVTLSSPLRCRIPMKP